MEAAQLLLKQQLSLALAHPARAFPPTARPEDARAAFRVIARTLASLYDEQGRALAQCRSTALAGAAAATAAARPAPPTRMPHTHDGGGGEAAEEEEAEENEEEKEKEKEEKEEKTSDGDEMPARSWRGLHADQMWEFVAMRDAALRRPLARALGALERDAKVGAESSSSSGGSDDFHDDEDEDAEAHDDEEEHDDEEGEEPLSPQESSEEEEEEEDEDEDEEEDEEEEEEEEDDDDDDDDDGKNDPSVLRARTGMDALIDHLEDGLLAPRPWLLRGEVSARERPPNSLLEEHVEFDTARKVRVEPASAPVHTEGIEAVIRRRVLDGAFDDPAPPRRRDDGDGDGDYDASRRKRARLLPELDHEKSREGLAAVFEREWRGAQARADPGAPAGRGKAGAADDPARLTADQREVLALFDKLSARLDALAHFQYRPAPIPDRASAARARPEGLPALALEEVAPFAVSDAQLRAPEEVFAPGKARGEVKADAELSSTDRRRKRRRRKKGQALGARGTPSARGAPLARGARARAPAATLPARLDARTVPVSGGGAPVAAAQLRL